ncbi:MAG TPA: ABATE domain-containing protein, partial [Ktedonobacterales bacterium]|nr:ABATE domain-containing protein [Ktedonobacterales bacterium]
MTNAELQAGTPHDSQSAHEVASPDGSLALELINTKVMERGKKRDLLTSPDALARWWADACERYPDECVVEGAGEPIAWTS